VQAIQPQNDALKLENYSRLLHQLARKCYSRLCEAGVSIDYEDVYQEMCLGYAKAVSGFDPSRGYAFTTYLVRACYNEFNKRYEKPIAERVQHGVFSVQEWSTDSDEDSGCLFDVIPDDAPTPEQRLMRYQQAKLIERCMSKTAQEVLMLLVRPSEELRAAFRQLQDHRQAKRNNGHPYTPVPDEITLSFIGKFLNIPRAKMTEVRQELSRLLEASY
jgi:RNA polymerase sigma factor (sigma-70 family)